MAELSPLPPRPVALPGVARCDGVGILAIARAGRLAPTLPLLPGFDPAIPPGSAVWTADATLLVPAPGEWLLLGEPATLRRFAEQGPAFLVTDLSDACTGLRLAPAVAARALAAYSPIDARRARRPDGCDRTLFGDADVLLALQPDGALCIFCEIALDSYLVALLARLGGD